MENKQYLSSLKVLVNTPKQWGAFNELLESNILLYQRKLEQAVDMVEIHQAQGAIQALRKLKQLREQVNAEKQ
jgi:hypothetical protein